MISERVGYDLHAVKDGLVSVMAQGPLEQLLSAERNSFSVRIICH